MFFEDLEVCDRIILLIVDEIELLDAGREEADHELGDPKELQRLQKFKLHPDYGAVVRQFRVSRWIRGRII